jgi:hypothetical protein
MVTMKNTVFWDVALCRSCVNRRFGGTYRLHLQCRKIRQSLYGVGTEGNGGGVLVPVSKKEGESTQ